MQLILPCVPTLKKTLFVLFIFVLYLNNTKSQPGTLDASFGIGGKTVIKKGFVRKLAQQQDGKIVVFGNNRTTTNRNSFLLTRLNIDGTADSSFGNAGRVETSMGDSISHYPLDLNLQNNGAITITGYSYINGVYKLVVQQFKTTGVADSAFGINGTLVMPLPANRIVNTAAIQPDGKILAGGFKYNNSTSYYAFWAMRFNENGNADSSFGINGETATKIFPANLFESGESILLQKDSKIMLLGRAYYGPGSGSDFTLVRYNQDGKPDSSYNGTGIATAAFGTNVISPSYFRYFEDIAWTGCVQQDKKVIAAGNSSIINITEPGDVETDDIAMGMMRFKENGTLDSSFAENGKLRLPGNSIISNGQSGRITSVITQQDGRILVAAALSVSNSARFFVARFNPNGSPDSSFGTNGFAIDSVSATSYTLLLQNDNKIVAGGISGSDIVIVRYNNSTILPVTLTNFNAIKKDKTTLLNWQTATEINSSYFQVQRSVNGQSFNAIGTVKSAGNTSIAQQYTFVDEAPANGINYYRLKQVDVNGHESFSKIETVNFNNSAPVLLYPNPVKNNFYVTNLPQTKTTITIVNTDGKLLYKQVNSNSTYTGNITALSSGKYYIIIFGMDGKKIAVLTLIKQ